MNCLQLRRSVVPWAADVSGHADGRAMPNLLTPLANGVLAGTAFGNSMLVASATVALATQGLSPVLSHFTVAGT